MEETWSGGEADVMLALHARRSHDSIRRYAAAHPGRPLLVVLTGTDLYRDIRSDPAAIESLELATRLAVLQPLGLEQLSAAQRAKARVIWQSAEPLERRDAASTRFEVLVVGHLRAEKDPFRAVLAAGLLPEASRVRVAHVGAAHTRDFAEQARAHTAATPRYRWLGELPHEGVRELLASARLLVQSSLLEGGANTVSEALAAGLPVLASDIPGNVGLLGGDYAGYYPAGDERALASLMERVELDRELYARLEAQCAARRHLTEPAREREALAALIADALR